MAAVTRKKNNTFAKEMILIVCATEAEALYFSQMRKDCRYANITVRKAECKEGLEALICHTAKMRKEGYFDTAWALFGYDDVNTDIDEVKELSPLAEKKRVGLCYFNPSFELWFALHLAPYSSFQADKSVLLDRIHSTKGLEDFEATEKYFLTKGLDLHMKLFPYHAKADINARNYNLAAKYTIGLDAITMPQLNADILEKCGQADMSHSSKGRM